MSYQQSLKNIEILKNLILPLDGHQIFFDFSNETEFKVLPLKNSESEQITDLIRDKFRSELPQAKIYTNKLDHVILHYEDSLISYKFNFTSESVVINDQKIGFRKKSTVEHTIEINK